MPSYRLNRLRARRLRAMRFITGRRRRTDSRSASLRMVAGGCVSGNVFGTYLHGLFDSGELTAKLAEFLCARKGIEPKQTSLLSMEDYRQKQFDLLADGVRHALNLDAIYRVMR